MAIRFLRTRVPRRWQLLFLMVGAAIGAAFSGAEPTGDHRVDQVLVPAFGALVVAAGARATLWMLLPMCVAPLLLVAATVWVGLSAGLFIVVFSGLQQRARTGRVVAGLIAALAVQSLLRMPPVLFFGFPSLVAGSAAAAVVAPAGVRFARARMRSDFNLGVPAAVLVGLVVVGGLFLRLEVQGIRADVDQGFEQLELAATAADRGDQEELVEAVERSRRSFESAGERLSSPSVRVARLLPVLSQQFRAADTGLGHAVALAGTAEAAVSVVDVNGLYSADGWIAFERLGPAEAATAALLAAVSDAEVAVGQIDRAWLVPSVNRTLDQSGDALADAAAGLDLAAEGLEVLPPVLGAEGEQRILVLLSTPAETREFGGFVGAYALLSTSADGVTIEASGPIGDLVGRTAQITDVTPFSEWYLRYDLARYPQNLTGSPDLGTIREAVEQLFPRLHGRPVDAVAYVDPDGISAFVEVLGSVTLPDSGRRLTGAQAREFLLRGQYFRWPNSDEQNERLSELLHRVFEQFFAEALPSPGQLRNVFGPRVAAGHIAVATGTERTDRFLQDVGLLRPFRHGSGSDVFGVVQVNGAPSKLDAYVHKSVHYEVSFDPGTGAVDATATVRLESTAPRQMPPSALAEDAPGGTAGHRILLSVYTPLELDDVLLDGWPLASLVFEEYGLTRAMVEVPLDRQGVATVRYNLRGSVAPGDYRLSLLRQPVATPDVVTVEVNPTEGWGLATGPDSASAPDGDSIGQPLDLHYEARRVGPAGGAQQAGS